eukprot:14561910-Alexandrium_andersonii.AAC.1
MHPHTASRSSHWTARTPAGPTLFWPLAVQWQRTPWIADWSLRVGDVRDLGLPRGPPSRPAFVGGDSESPRATAQNAPIGSFRGQL